MPVSIVPSETRHTVYQVLDDLGERYGYVWPEIGDDEATKQPSSSGSSKDNSSVPCASLHSIPMKAGRVM